MYMCICTCSMCDVFEADSSCKCISSGSAFLQGGCTYTSTLYIEKRDRGFEVQGRFLGKHGLLFIYAVAFILDVYMYMHVHYSLV